MKPLPELVADATVEARIFLERVKPRTLKTDKGRVVTTTELAEGLVKRAALEHAVVKGKRPKSILCADCKRVVRVGAGGRVPKRCKRCSYRAQSASYRARKPDVARRIAEASSRKPERREWQRNWRAGAGKDKVRAGKARYRAEHPEKIAAYDRAYVEKNREKINAKRRARYRPRSSTPG